MDPLQQTLYDELTQIQIRDDGTFPGKRKRMLDPPLLIWKKEYEKDDTLWLNQIQQLSDSMLFNESGIYDDDNPNTPHLFNVAKGKIDPKDYVAAEMAYGYKGLTPMRDNHFFYAAKSHTLGEIVKQPLKYTVKNISNEYSFKKLKKDKSNAKKLLKNLLSQQAASQDGVNLDFLEDKSISLAAPIDEVLDRLFASDEMELILFKILQHVNNEQNLLKLGRDCFDNKFDINSEFAFVDVVNGEVVVKHVHPSNVRMVGKRGIETFEDSGLVAASVIDYLTLTEVMDKYGDILDTGTGAKGLLDAAKKLRDGVECIYDPSRPYFSEYYKTNVLTSVANNFSEHTNPQFGRADYFRNVFYPFQKGAYALSNTILEQKMFFKVSVPKKYLVEMNGKPTTAREVEQWRKTIDDDRTMIANWIEIDPNEKPPKGYTEEKHKRELWEATRIGHGTLLDVGRYKYATVKPVKERYVGMPIVAQISREKSLVLVGENFARMTNTLFNRIEDIVNLSGLNAALLIDEAIIGSGHAKDALYSAKKTGILMYNSSKMVGSNEYTQKHLTMLQMGNHINEINNMLTLIGILNEGYNRIIGTSEQVQGISNPYESGAKQQMNIAAQSQLKVEKFYEHNLFMNQVLQRVGDVSKHVYAREGYINVKLSDGEREFLKLSKDLNVADFDIYLESGAALKDKKAILDNAVMQVLSSGGIDMLEPLINILYTDNPAEALSIFRKAKEELQAAQQQAQQAASQQAQLQAQTMQQKNQIPVDVAQIQAQSAANVQQLKNDEQRKREDAKGALNDINDTNKTQDKLLDHELNKDSQSYQAGLEAQLERLRQENEALKMAQQNKQQEPQTV